MGCGPCADRALFLIGEPIYDPTHTYGEGDFVVVAGVLYKSLQDGNLHHNPQEYPTWWTRTTILEELREDEGGGGGAGIYAPLVNGDLPGPTAIADEYGQFIMVEIS